MNKIITTSLISLFLVSNAHLMASYNPNKNIKITGVTTKTHQTNSNITICTFTTTDNSTGATGVHEARMVRGQILGGATILTKVRPDECSFSSNEYQEALKNLNQNS